MKHTTHFGYQEIPIDEKTKKVGAVFDSVADRYDFMNDLMSFGLHRWWKHSAIIEANIREGHQVLDIASGTGDLALQIAKYVGKKGRVVLTDINNAMLMQGRDRLLDHGFFNNISVVLANGETLPFKPNSFDCLTIAFGLRNFTNIPQALHSFYSVLKPGGKLIILEFSHTRLPLIRKLYDLYSFKLIPKMGEWVTKKRQSYEYLVESIRMHPDQETLAGMMSDASFDDVEYYNYTFGIVATHIGYKY